MPGCLFSGHTYSVLLSIRIGLDAFQTRCSSSFVLLKFMSGVCICPGHVWALGPLRLPRISWYSTGLSHGSPNPQKHLILRFYHWTSFQGTTKSEHWFSEHHLRNEPLSSKDWFLASLNMLLSYAWGINLPYVFRYTLYVLFIKFFNRVFIFYNYSLLS